MSAPHLRVDELEVRRDRRFRLGPLHFVVAPGECVVLAGANGCGKSTLLAALTGQLPFASGRVLVAGLDVQAEPLAVRARVGTAVAPGHLPGALTARQCLDFVATLRGPSPGLPGLAAALGFDAFDVPVRTLSLGARQKVAVLLALSGAPAVLLLDEVFNGLDAAAARALWQELADRTRAGTTVLLATHHLERAARAADRLLLLDDGRLVADWSGEAWRAARARGIDDAIADAVAQARRRTDP